MSDDAGTEVATRPVKDTALDLRGKRKKISAKGLIFLRSYGESMDEGEAAKIAGFRDVHAAMECDVIVAEMERIQIAWFHENRMNAKFASGEHMRLMEKFEDKYDIMDHDGQAKMASVLAKMSETALKASGKMEQNADQARTQVLVQLNIGNSAGDQLKDIGPIDINLTSNKGV